MEGRKEGKKERDRDRETEREDSTRILIKEVEGNKSKKTLNDSSPMTD